MAWKIIFITSSGKGNLTISRYLKFENGYLIVEDNEDQALIALQRPNLGVDFHVYKTKGTLPGSVQEAMNAFEPGTMGKGPGLPRAGIEMETAVRATAPEVPGLDVVDGQPEMPLEEAVIMPAEYGGPDVDIEIPEVGIDGEADLLLLGRSDLEVKANELGIDNPSEFRNDDLLVAAIMEAEAELKTQAELEDAVGDTEPKEQYLGDMDRAALVAKLEEMELSLDDVESEKGVPSNVEIRAFIIGNKEAADAEPEGSEVESVPGGEGPNGAGDAPAAG